MDSNAKYRHCLIILVALEIEPLHPVSFFYIFFYIYRKIPVILQRYRQNITFIRKGFL